MSNVFFTSDPHFHHKKILVYCPETRPETTVEEMNARIIERWNQQVKPEDSVWILGDLSFSNTTKTIEVLKQLNGNLNVVLGNHDPSIDTVKSWGIFKEVCDIKYLHIEGKHIFMCHYPVFEWRDIHRGSYHLHGHLHGKKLNMHEGRYLDVGMDTRKDYTLYSFEEVVDILESKPILKRG